MVMLLSDIALFKVAHSLWHIHDDFNCRISRGSWKMCGCEVASYVQEYYPGIPASIERRIVNCIEIIGEELGQLVAYRDLNYSYTNCLSQLRPCDILWTYFTIDRLRTLSLICSMKVQIRDYSQPIPVWIQSMWDKQSEQVKSLAKEYFASESFFVFLHYVCYMRTAAVNERRDHFFSDHLNYFMKVYQKNSPLENVFRFMVISGNVQLFSYYLSKMNPEMRRKNILTMVRTFLTGYNSYHYRHGDYIVSYTMSCLWNNMEISDRASIVQNYFREFFYFVESYTKTEVLIPALSWYDPSKLHIRDNRRYLKLVVTNMQANSNTSNTKYQQIFRIMYERAVTLLNVVDVVELLEKILLANDMETAVLMVQILDKEKKDELLDAIHFIWNDLWKDSIQMETYLTFFFEVQSGIIGPVMGQDD